jgi:hypothetical protein
LINFVAAASFGASRSYVVEREFYRSITPYPNAASGSVDRRRYDG